jgi:multicomponent Na+:H+ antiporter subunit B
VIFFSVMLATGSAAMLSRDLRAAVVYFGLFSFAAATVYTLMRAVDVAFTEAVVGAVTTVFYLTVIHRTGGRASS